MAITQIQIFIFLIVLACVLFLSGITALIWWILSLRNYIFEVKEGKRIKVHRQFRWVKNKKLTFKGNDYIVTEKCIGEVKGRWGVYLKVGMPTAFNWIDFCSEKVKYDYLSQDTINAIINDEHVRIVASAGQTKINSIDIVIIILICAILFISVLIAGKQFGFIKSAPVQCVYNMTQFVK